MQIPATMTATESIHTGYLHESLVLRGLGPRAYVILSVRGEKRIKVLVDTVAQASQAWQTYRDLLCCGASQMRHECGQVHATTGELLARVSYNGRVWTPEGEECVF